MKVSLSKFGSILISRPMGKEALRSFAPHLRKSKKETIELDFDQIISIAPSWLDEFVTGLKTLGHEVKYLSTRNPSAIQSIKIIEETQSEIMEQNKVHPLRLCPVGEHWVKTHPRRVNRSRKNPFGFTEVDGRCRTNRSKKDSIYADEIHEIFHRAGNSTGPMPNTLKDFKKKNQFDQEIAFWTSYWNQVFKPKQWLSPNIIKALIASESSFDIKPKNSKAIGLMQLLPKTVKILGDFKGELKDNLVHITRTEATESNINIASGVRWLFYKQADATRKLKREATWDEAVAHYKSYLSNWLKGKPAKGMDKYLEFLKELEP